MNNPRVLMLSERNAEIPKWQAPQYEFEDVVGEVDSVAMIAPPAVTRSKVSRARRKLLRAAGRRAFRAPKLRSTDVSGEYDVFFAVLMFPDKAPNLLALRDWRSRCDKAVCFIVELFSEHVEDMAENLELLAELRFDRIFVLNPRPKDAIAERTGSKVEFLPLGVDALRFSPCPLLPARSVDLYQFGRRSPVTHDAALELARRDGAFYVYDTVFNKVPLEDHVTHRTMMAEYMKRTRYFFSYRPGEDLDRGRDDDALSSRYFEATAGGAVLLGSSPDSAEYRDTFGWPDATIEIPYEARNLREIIAGLDEQPERLARARVNNVTHSLRRHDWVHRWGRVLDAAGMPHTEAMRERMRLLESLALETEARLTADLERTTIQR